MELVEQEYASVVSTPHHLLSSLTHPTCEGNERRGGRGGGGEQEEGRGGGEGGGTIAKGHTLQCGQKLIERYDNVMVCGMT